MKKKLYKSAILALFTIAFTACESNEEPVQPLIPYSEGAYILNFGKGSNSSSLSYYDFASGSVSNGVFKTQNDKILGDKANHMCAYGSKLYIAVSNSGKIEVTDLNGVRLKKIELKNEEGLPLNPRYIVSHNGYIYFSAYGGSVQRIDTLNLNLDSRKVVVGDYPEAMTIAGNRLFVNNSKYKSANVNDKGNTVSVIDLTSFTKTDDIEVPSNPYDQALTGADGNVYIVTVSDWSNPKLQRINPNTYEVTELGQASVIAEYNKTLYTYFSVYNGDSWFKTYDLATGKLAENIFLDVAQFDYIQALNIDPLSGYLYISDSRNNEKGIISVYTPQGELKTSFDVDYSPKGAFFPVLNK